MSGFVAESKMLMASERENYFFEQFKKTREFHWQGNQSIQFFRMFKKRVGAMLDTIQQFLSRRSRATYCVFRSHTTTVIL